MGGVTLGEVLCSGSPGGVETQGSKLDRIGVEAAVEVVEGDHQATGLGGSGAVQDQQVSGLGGGPCHQVSLYPHDKGGGGE